MDTSELESLAPARPRVIVVDDNLTTCMVLRAIFQKEFEVLIAQSGEECVELARIVSPALILMDIEMPGMRGYDACRAVRQVTNAPVVFVSGHDDLEAHLDALEAGGQDFVLKPFDAKTLLNKTRALVRQTWAPLEATSPAAPPAPAGDGGDPNGQVLLEFLRNALGSKDLYLLADHVLAALAGYGLHGVVQIRHDSLAVTVDRHGQEACPLAITLCEQIRRMPSSACGTHFIANCRDVTILVLHLPASHGAAGIQTLAAMTQSIAEQIAAHLALTYQAEDVQVQTTRAQIAVEQLRLHYRSVQSKERIQLEGMLQELKCEVTGRAGGSAEELGQLVDGFTWNLLALMDASRDDAETTADRLLGTLMPSREDDPRWY